MKPGSTDSLQLLRPIQRAGSRPRCHWLTEGLAYPVADRLTEMMAPHGVVSPSDHWMPQGFDVLDEAELHSAERLLPSDVRQRLLDWWLAVPHARARTPNFDIASTCTIEGRRSLLLVEAKAHLEELEKERAGKPLAIDEKKGKPSEAARSNHDRIGAAIEVARAGLERDIAAAPGSASWRISSDLHYQMSNRFAWAWKVAEQGIPVILVYLGFLRAEEMAERGRRTFDSPGDWERAVREHSAAIAPEGIWNQRWTVCGQPFVPLIRSREVSLSGEVSQ